MSTATASATHYEVRFEVAVQPGSAMPLDTDADLVAAAGRSPVPGTINVEKLGDLPPKINGVTPVYVDADGRPRNIHVGDVGYEALLVSDVTGREILLTADDIRLILPLAARMAVGERLVP